METFIGQGVAVDWDAIMTKRKLPLMVLILLELPPQTCVRLQLTLSPRSLIFH